ncbi:hypothetical protein F8M41_000194 [Gigaspora margarita]|uniref:Uncharacterized protein n=1 Tax=Gigaspora margarita TaxID=4874 RepID=A0A8H4A952_GIGMA|nr:hypothetical protein F8M41_000194 [Gigaspora margarita]
MASKIFMGDMPEILEKILNNLNNEFYSLYSCVLPEIFYTLGENKQFFSRIQYLSLDEISDDNIENAITLLRALAKHAKKISTLKINNFDTYYFETQLVYVLINVIKSQEQLRLFSFVGYNYPRNFHGIISALDNQKSSLQEVRVDYCAFNAEFDVLNNCKNLETLNIRFCDTKLWNILDCKISTLEIIDETTDTQSIALILEKSGLLLQRLNVDVVVTDDGKESLLLEAIKSFCPNITYLNINNLGFSTQLVELIGNLQKLQFLSLRCDVFEIPEEELKLRVMQFSEILPLTLQYFDLGNTWLEPYIDVLFNHCNAPLKKILIYHLCDEKISRALVEFCIRNKALKYVGIYKYSNLDENIRREVEAYVALVPYERIVVNC